LELSGFQPGDDARCGPLVFAGDRAESFEEFCSSAHRQLRVRRLDDGSSVRIRTHRHPVLARRQSERIRRLVSSVRAVLDVEPGSRGDDQDRCNHAQNQGRILRRPIGDPVACLLELAECISGGIRFLLRHDTILIMAIRARIAQSWGLSARTRYELCTPEHLGFGRRSVSETS